MLRICHQCGESFPSSIKIGGKKRRLTHRKYCLDCFPFQARNVSQIKIIKKCPKCSLESEYGKGSYCKKCTNIQTKKRQKALKQETANYKGGKCMICGQKHISTLEFHHRDQKDKNFSIGHRQTCNLEELKNELDKCDLLCRNCHAELHYAREDSNF